MGSADRETAIQMGAPQKECHVWEAVEEPIQPEALLAWSAASHSTHCQQGVVSKGGSWSSLHCKRRVHGQACVVSKGGRRVPHMALVVSNMAPIVRGIA